MTGLGPKLVAFFAAEDGAVTVDWVVLTAAVVRDARSWSSPRSQAITESISSENTATYIDNVPVKTAEHSRQ